MNKDMIIYEVNNIDLYDLNSNQLRELKNEIINNVNISKLEEKINQVILKLSGVGEPSFGADIKYIALDNQKRLNLIYMLSYNFNLFKADVKYLKRHKNDPSIDDEKIFMFLLKTKDIINTILDYGEFTLKEQEEQLKYLNDVNKRLYIKDENKTFNKKM